jgi:hypothetical protein
VRYSEFWGVSIDHVSGHGSERDSDADFIRAPRNGIGQDAVLPQGDSRLDFYYDLVETALRKRTKILKVVA